MLFVTQIFKSARYELGTMLLDVERCILFVLEENRAAWVASCKYARFAGSNAKCSFSRNVQQGLLKSLYAHTDNCNGLGAHFRQNYMLYGVRYYVTYYYLFLFVWCKQYVR